MKTLVEYIHEASEEKKTVPSSKTFSFNFSSMEGVEDFMKSVTELGSDLVEVEDNKVKVTVSKEDTAAAEGVFELLQDFIHLRGKDQKVASDESYAQKVHKLNDVLNDWREYVDDSAEEAEDQKEADKKEEEKKEEE